MSLRFLTAGESHGKALIGILEGMPSGLSVTEGELRHELKRRKLGYGRGARQKIEDDAVEIISGIRHGKTLGSPVGLLIWNKDWLAWKEVMRVENAQLSPARARDREVRIPRPGHADLVGGMKYDHSDMRNVLERASARETTIRVALGAVTRSFLRELGVEIGSRVVQIGKARDSSEFKGEISSLNSSVDVSPVRCLSRSAEKRMVSEITRAQRAGDTVGGVVEVLVSGQPLGLGSYAQWDRRIEGGIARALMSLNAIKGVEIGSGFALSSLPGSQSHDAFAPGKRRKVRYLTNRSGGIDGGMTTGQRLVIRAAMKPLATLMKPLPSVDLRTGKSAKAHIERSDVCAVPSAAVIVESLVAIVLAEAILEKFGGDSMKEIVPRVRKWNQASIVE